MPAIPAVLGSLIQSNVDSQMKAIKLSNGKGPMSQQNPAFFIAMCMAIGTGIAAGTPAIMFTTTDNGSTSVPPLPGAGTGIGVVVDADYLEQQIYTNCRQAILDSFGKTSHDAYPPGDDNSGMYLKAVAKGVAVAVKSHYATAWTLTSVHPLIYMGSGEIKAGNFKGIVASAVESLMIAAAPQLKGPFWPKMCKAIAMAYADTIHKKSTGKVNIIGVCVPSPAQVCGIPSSGTGTGVAA